MKITKLVLASSLSSMLLALGAAGCEKSADLGRMQESTLELVKLHQGEIDTLQRRADGDMQRGRAVGADGPGIAEAGRTLSEARAGIDQLRALANASSAQLANAVKGGDGDEVERQSDEVLEKLTAGEIVVKKNLVSVENWLMSVENRPAAQASAPAAPTKPPAMDEAPASGGAAPTGTETPAPAPTPGNGEAGSGSGTGSASK